GSFLFCALDAVTRTYLERRQGCLFVRRTNCSQDWRDRRGAMLTRKQHELLTFIDRHLKATGFSPSFEERKEAPNLRSKSGIHRLISALEERGFLQRRHHRARALEVVRRPEDQAAHNLAVGEVVRGDAAFAPNVIRGDFSGRLPGVRAAGEAAAIQLPLY